MSLRSTPLQHSSYMDEVNCDARKRNLFFCSSSQGSYWMQKVYPPVIEQEPHILALAVLFTLCFIISLAGNVSVLTIIYGIFKERRCSGVQGRGEQTMKYVVALCITDICISLSLPTAVADNLLGFWLFGGWVCKLHHVCGSVGRIVSTFLITAISFDRFASVCLPSSHPLRSPLFVSRVIAGVVVSALILLLPLLIYADIKEFIIHEFVAPDGNVTRVRVYKCTDAMPTNVFFYFTYSTFTLGFVLPLSLIVVFDYKLLRRLLIHSREHPNTVIPLRRIVRYTVGIAAIYFVGWTPYWWGVLYGSYFILRYGEGLSPSRDTVFVIYVLHVFPYLAIAMNWVLYGLLNTQLQQRVSSDSCRAISHRSSATNPQAQFLPLSLPKDTSIRSIAGHNVNDTLL